MFRLARTQFQPIGVDIGFDSVKLLQLEVVGEQLAVVAAARQNLPDEARQQPNLRLPVAMDMLRRMIGSGSFVGRSIIAALPRDIVQVKNLRLPNMPAAELESAVQFEARNIFPFETDQAQIRHLQAGEVKQGADVRQEVIVLAANDLEVNDFLEQLHRTGVVVESLDFEPAALYRGIERFLRRKVDEQDVNVLVDIGSRRTQVVIGRGREISFYKPIDIGGQNLHDAVARKLGISLEETRGLRRRLSESKDGQTGSATGGVAAVSAKRDPVRQAVYDATRGIIEELAREIALCLRYYSVTFRGHRPGKIRVSGGGACDPQVIATLGANLPVPVEAARPLYSVDMTRMKPADRPGNLSEWAVALGLSLKGVQQTFAPRDGKKRDPNSPHNDARGANETQVIDLNRAMAAANGQLVPAGAASEEEAVRA